MSNFSNRELRLNTESLSYKNCLYILLGIRRHHAVMNDMWSFPDAKSVTEHDCNMKMVERRRARAADVCNFGRRRRHE